MDCDCRHCGWRYWRSHEAEQAQTAAGMYQTMLMASAKGDANMTTLVANKLIQNFNHTPYATMASFVLADNAVEKNQYAKAVDSLQWVIKHSNQASFKQIARCRAARLLLQQKQYQLALTMINTVNDKTFMPVINQIQGNIYQAMSNHDKALDSWQKAQSGFTASGLMDPILNMQLAS